MLPCQLLLLFTRRKKKSFVACKVWLLGKEFKVCVVRLTTIKRESVRDADFTIVFALA